MVILLKYNDDYSTVSTIIY
jgi:hypothetical protein